ncbi:ATP-binding cassette domain-containing protein [Pseudarthrobacter sulfonivorans]|uniref:ATP-binding cassette domain-containing protein n=1 Tax=Pseudarthrobacter sulfonivorans TaxID=121292 RepID=UPI0021077BF3|nr:ABC transporter ATP-binding protein [Pseudarthrobacter sulfonivorans]
MLLSVNHVNYSYNPRAQVLHDVSFDIAENQIIGLIGPNGSGKSTLIKIILDLLKLQGGTVAIAGGGNQDRAAKMASIYLSSNDYLPEFLSGAEYLSFVHGLYGEKPDTAEVARQFERYSMRGRQGDLIEDYSHGMRKKVQLIAALMLKRPLTVIDETLNGVDLDAVFTFETDVRELASGGRSVLLCSHDFSMLERTADEVMVLNMGALVSKSATSEILEVSGSLGSLARELVQAMDVP